MMLVTNLFLHLSMSKVKEDTQNLKKNSDAKKLYESSKTNSFRWKVLSDECSNISQKLNLLKNNLKK